MVLNVAIAGIVADDVFVVLSVVFIFTVVTVDIYVYTVSVAFIVHFVTVNIDAIVAITVADYVVMALINAVVTVLI